MRSFKEYKNRIIITVRILFLVLLFTQLRAGRVYAAAAESASAAHKIGIEADLIAEEAELAGEPVLSKERPSAVSLRSAWMPRAAQG